MVSVKRPRSDANGVGKMKQYASVESEWAHPETHPQKARWHRSRWPEERERRWFVRKRPRRDINLGSETQVTVTSKRHAQAERAKRYAVTVFSQSAQVHVQYGDAPPREAESEGAPAETNGDTSVAANPNVRFFFFVVHR